MSKKHHDSTEPTVASDALALLAEPIVPDAIDLDAEGFTDAAQAVLAMHRAQQLAMRTVDVNDIESVRAHRAALARMQGLGEALHARWGMKEPEAVEKPADAV